MQSHPYQRVVTNEDLRSSNARLKTQKKKLRRKMKRSNHYLKFLCCLPLLLWAVIRIYAAVDCHFNLDVHLSKAVSSHSIDTVKNELFAARQYIADKGGVTRASTDIFTRDCDGDIRAWLHSMSTTKEMLTIFPSFSKWHDSDYYYVDSMVRPQLTETPAGISIYPYNVPMFWLSILGVIMAVAALVPPHAHRRIRSTLLTLLVRCKFIEIEYDE